MVAQIGEIARIPIFRLGKGRGGHGIIFWNHGLATLTPDFLTHSMLC